MNPGAFMPGIFVRQDNEWQLLHFFCRINCAYDRYNTAYFDETLVSELVIPLSRSSAADSAEWVDHAFPGHDPLTGLPGRLIFEKKARQVLRAGNSVAIAMIELNQFRLVYEAMGHSFAENLLFKVADRLVGSLRHEDLLAHWSGDQFALLLPASATEAEAADAIRHVLGSLNEAFCVTGKAVVQTATAGIALAPRDGISPEELLCAAHIALNQVKLTGVHHFGFFHQGNAALARYRFNLSTDLRSALKSGEISVVYQPQLDAITNALVGLEALARWNHPQLGLISPLDFIAIAEDHQVIVELGAYLFRIVCAQLQTWRRDTDFKCKIAVNVSPQQIKPDFPRFVRELLREYEVPPAQIEIEVTESLFDPSSAELDILHELRAIGVSLALDDFGTGYSSLSRLKHLPFDRLKIDKSFVDGLPENPSDISIMQAVISLGLALSKNILAEGVETLEQATFLREHGVHALQGFLFSRPVPAGGVLPYLASFSAPLVAKV